MHRWGVQVESLVQILPQWLQVLVCVNRYFCGGALLRQFRSGANCRADGVQKRRKGVASGRLRISEWCVEFIYGTGPATTAQLKLSTGLGTECRYSLLLRMNVRSASSRVVAARKMGRR
jgi:hypothetical protein